MPKKLRQRLQFRISTVLILAIPLAVSCVWLADVINDRPIEWVPFDSTALLKHLKSDDLVLVFATADWDATAQVVEKRTVNTLGVRKLIRTHNIVMMRADFTTNSPTAVNWIKTIDRRTTPLIVIYRPDTPDFPTILEGIPTKKQLVDAIRNGK